MLERGISADTRVVRGSNAEICSEMQPQVDVGG